MAPLLSISIRMPQWSKNNERKLKLRIKIVSYASRVWTKIKQAKQQSMERGIVASTMMFWKDRVKRRQLEKEKGRKGHRRNRTETYSGKMNSDAKKKRKKKIRGRGIEGLTGGSGVGPPAKKEKKTGRNRSTEQSNRLRSGREVYLRSGLLWNSPNTQRILKPVE